MDWATITPLIGVIGSAIGTFAGIMINSKLVNYRIEQLEKKVDKHNQVIDRVYKLEKSEAVFEEEMSTVTEKLHELEQYHK